MVDENCLADLKQSCEYIKNKLEGFHNGLVYDTQMDDMVDMDTMVERGNGYYNTERFLDVESYLSNNHGVTITKNIGYDDNEFNSCCITMVTGGPGIYINTETEMIEGRWWGTNCDVPISHAICLMVERAIISLYM